MIDININIIEINISYYFFADGYFAGVQITTSLNLIKFSIIQKVKL